MSIETLNLLLNQELCNDNHILNYTKVLLQPNRLVRLIWLAYIIYMAYILKFFESKNTMISRLVDMVRD